MEKKIVDARGLACPLPVVNAKKAVGKFREDGVLTVLVDNEIAVQNLKKFAGQKGLTASGEKKAEKEYEVTIRWCWRRGPEQQMPRWVVPVGLGLPGPWEPGCLAAMGLPGPQTPARPMVLLPAPRISAGRAWWWFCLPMSWAMGRPSWARP